MVNPHIHIEANADGSARLIINDGTHGPHTEENPDDGSTSQFALDLAAAMEQLGMEAVVSRLD